MPLPDLYGILDLASIIVAHEIENYAECRPFPVPNVENTTNKTLVKNNKRPKNSMFSESIVGRFLLNRSK